MTDVARAMPSRRDSAGTAALLTVLVLVRAATYLMPQTKAASS
jgi:hypothetical protein